MLPGLRPRTPLGEITELPQTPSWFSGSRFAAGERKGKGGEGRERGKGKGVSVPPLLFYNLTTAQQCIVAATYTVHGR